jgi:hypothetical protein
MHVQSRRETGDESIFRACVFVVINTDGQRPTSPSHRTTSDTSSNAWSRSTMPAEQASVEVRRKAAREVIDILHEIATLLVSPAALR